MNDDRNQRTLWPDTPVVTHERNRRGRDFVAGDIHAHFDTLEQALEQLAFDPTRDRLFSVGDLIDRGPRSPDAFEWMEQRRITLSVRGNHEQMFTDRIRIAQRAWNDHHPWMMHPWFATDVRPTEWTRWQAMIARMPIAAAIATRRGEIGLIHASPTARYWQTTLRKLIAGDSDTIAAALWSSARARGQAGVAEFEGVPVDGTIHGEIGLIRASPTARYWETTRARLRAATDKAQGRMESPDTPAGKSASCRVQVKMPFLIRTSRIRAGSSVARSDVRTCSSEKTRAMAARVSRCSSVDSSGTSRPKTRSTGT